MKQIILMRHAEAEPERKSASDFERALTDTGRSMARVTAALLRENGIRLCRIIASSAARTTQTAEIVQAEFDLLSPLILRDELYHADASLYLSVAAEEAQDDDSCVLIVGHNPGMAELMMACSLRSLSVPPSTAAVFDTDIPQWQTLLTPVRTGFRRRLMICEGRLVQ
jgi:phosphohistidine phosphatase